MISPAYAQTMAAYNAELNRRIYAAAGRLTDAARREDRGAFWRSIHGTLSHLLWADTMWLSRFGEYEKPQRTLRESGDAFPDFAAMADRRRTIDVDIDAWAALLSDGWLREDQSWFSAAAQRQIAAPRTKLVMHLFNHQTHHRGQVHAMLTAAGETTGDTDLLLVVG